MKRQKSNQGRRHTGRLERRGTKWLAIWMVDGKRRSQTTGETDKAEAEKWLAKKMNDIRLADELKRNARDKEEMQARLQTYVKGRLVEIDDERQTLERRSALRIADAWPEFLNHPNRKRVVQATLDNTHRTFERFAAWCAREHSGCVEMRDVTGDIALEYAGSIRPELSPATYNCTISALQQIWSLLARKAKVTENPWTRQNIARQTAAGSSIRRGFTEAELSDVFREAKNYKPPLHRLFTMLLYTGLRLSDAALMRWDAIDLGRGTISLVPIKNARFGERARVKIPILPPLRAMLEQTPAGQRNGFVMPDIADEYENRALNRIVTTFLEKKCGIVTRRKTDIGKRRHSEVSAHAFRHTFVSLAANAGVPFAIVQKIVGHQTAQMSEHYFHEDETAAQRAFRAFPIIAETDADCVDAKGRTVVSARVDELRRIVREIAAGGDAAELKAALKAVREAAGVKR